MTNKQWAIWKMIDMSDWEMAIFIYRLHVGDLSPYKPIPKKLCEECADWLKQEHKDEN